MKPLTTKRSPALADAGALARGVFLAFLACPAALAAQAPGTVHGFSPARLERIDRFLEQAVDSGRVAGAVALVLRDGHIVYERAVGWADREAGRRMDPGAMFRIASKTKALTTTAILILAEEGRVSLGDPVSRFIPAYARTSVALRADSGRTVVPARRAITIRDLLTHTAGISYGVDAAVADRYVAAGLGRSAGWGWYTADKDEPTCATMERLATLPFVAQPGEGFVYGYATDVLGCVVERASGVPLDDFIRTRITAPLGMHDTHFFVPAGKKARLAAVYASDTLGSYVRAPVGARGQGHYVEGPRRSFSGGAGLVSTARDYGRFLQMLLNGGTLDGVRILSPKTVDVMTSNQVGSLYTQDGQGFGLGFYTVERPGGNGLATVGSWGWGSAYGGTYLVDPREGVVVVFMIQQVPNRSDVPAKFPTLVYQALVEPRATSMGSRR